MIAYASFFYECADISREKLQRESIGFLSKDADDFKTGTG